MQIKTVAHNQASAFDLQVNQLLSQNWCLVKRGVIVNGDKSCFYAELAQYDPSSPIDPPVQSEKQQEIVLPPENDNLTSHDVGELYNAMLKIHRFCATQDFCPSCPIYRICGSELPDRWEC